MLQRVGRDVEWRIQRYGARTDTFTFDIAQPRLDSMGETRKIDQ